MSYYQLKAQQEIPISKAEAWEFLSNPANLSTITPDHMGFKILSGADRAMYPGQIIQYTVSPLAGLNTRWVTEITHVREGAYFVDEQRFGPYALWHHKHFISETDSGVLMEDIIDYKLPFGLLGRWAHGIFVKKQLNSIFQYREKKLVELFGKTDGHPSHVEIKKI